MSIHKLCPNAIRIICIIIMLVNGIGYESLHTDSVFVVEQSGTQAFRSPEAMARAEVLLLAEQNSHKAQALAAELFGGSRGQLQRRNQEEMLMAILVVLLFVFITLLQGYYRHKRERVTKSMLQVLYMRRADGKKQIITIEA